MEPYEEGGVVCSGVQVRMLIAVEIKQMLAI